MTAVRSALGLPCSEPPATRPPPLTEAEVDAILQRIQRRFSWPDMVDRFVLEETWDSRPSTMYRCRGASAGTPDVVLKVGHRSTPDDARRLHAEMETLAEEMGRHGGTVVRLPRTLGWHDDPPSICMPYLDGTPVLPLLGDPTHSAWNGGGWDPAGLVAECGRALGAYHAPSATSASSSLLEEPELRKGAGKMWVSPRMLARAGHALVHARRFDDIGPHNFFLTASGELYLLDPPPDPSMTPVHRDVARFLYGIGRALAVEQSLPRLRLRRAEADLREAFLRGYAETGPIDVRTPSSRWLIALYEGVGARGTTRQQLRGRCYGEALRHGLRWVGRLLQVHLRRPSPG